MVVDVRMALPSLDFDFLVAGIVILFLESVSDNIFMSGGVPVKVSRGLEIILKI